MITEEEFTKLYSSLTREQQVELINQWLELLDAHNSIKKVRGLGKEKYPPRAYRVGILLTVHI